AVGGEPHNLVFIAVVRKAEILRQRLVENSQRMREVHAPVHRNRICATDAPGRAREIAETIDGYGCRLRERRNVKSGIKMRQVVLDAVERALEVFPGKRLFQELGDALALATGPQPVDYEAEVRPLRGDVADLAKEVRAAVLVHRDMIDVVQAGASCLQTIGNRPRGEAGPVFYPAETFFLRRSDKYAVA